MQIDISANLMKVLMVVASLGAFGIGAWSDPGIVQAACVGLGGTLSAWALGKRPGDVRRPRTSKELVRYVSEIPAPLRKEAQRIVSMAPGPLEGEEIPATSLTAFPSVPKNDSTHLGGKS